MNDTPTETIKLYMDAIEDTIVETHPHPEFDRAVVAKKIAVLHGLLLAGEADGSQRYGITELELLTTTPSSEWDSLRYALYELMQGGHIEKDAYMPYETGVFISYKLTETIPTSLMVAVSADQGIKRLLGQLETRIHQDGIASLAADEWALIPLLDEAHRQVAHGGTDGKGDIRVDTTTIHRRILDDLHDEGVEKWHCAFVSAIRQAELLFRPQE